MYRAQWRQESAPFISPLFFGREVGWLQPAVLKRTIPRQKESTKSRPSDADIRDESSKYEPYASVTGNRRTVKKKRTNETRYEMWEARSTLSLSLVRIHTNINRMGYRNDFVRAHSALKPSIRFESIQDFLSHFLLLFLLLRRLLTWTKTLCCVRAFCDTTKTYPRLYPLDPSFFLFDRLCARSWEF